ncbi:Ribosomal RNA small subunit methyltransferase A [Triticum urartu]|uniref:rRNA adenine N(6)-methyltransferase n=1 Tax=Triticum urartu TaxID=4572 RepID=M8AG77_TRIUA|nr:Ribosomal RNA small subunit methyltransferase A [Triticum urartu]
MERVLRDRNTIQGGWMWSETRIAAAGGWYVLRGTRSRYQALEVGEGPGGKPALRPGVEIIGAAAVEGEPAGGAGVLGDYVGDGRGVLGAGGGEDLEVERRGAPEDKHMATLVRDRFGSTEQLKVIEEDITKFHVHSHFLPILEEKSRGKKKYAKVVSNLPFNVSTEVVKQILPMGDVFSVMVLMLQDEAALRLANASIQTPEYRPINVFVNFYSEPEYKFKVERANFFPQPTVDGGVIRFKIKDAGEYPPVSSNKSFFSMVNSAFNGKRKMLRKSLQHLCSSADIEAALTNIDLPPTARPSELGMDDFVRLHNHLGKIMLADSNRLAFPSSPTAFTTT